MNKINILVYIIIFTLIFSCTEKKSPEREITKSEIDISSKNENLKFTSGIRTILKDSKNNFWIGSHREGVCLFDGKSFKYFTTNEGLSDNQIISIQEDNFGNIWLGTANGVSSYNGRKFTVHNLTINSGLQIKLESEWAKSKNDLWFNAGNNEGVYRYNGQKLNYLAFPNPKVINPDNVYFVTCLSEGKNEMLWIGTYAGIFGYNGNRFTIINDESFGLNKEKGELHIRSILEDSQGRLWIGNNGIGVLLHDGGVTINFSENNNLIHPSSSRKGDKSEAGTLEHVFAIEEDADGNIWFGDRDTGAWKYDGEKMTNYIIDVNTPSLMVWTIYNDDNNLFFGMSNGEVYKFNGKSFDQTF